ncbi:DUF4124 domain-containing protein [Accumulibacter sp.]|uniref:DUF4124 domain-containing protein n=1 Tax=Accumulibacter sp. TaxID=2053492 RepID=UPI0025EC5385|nr:DUF4124 domain-containing protein [Accumulibacter sp.]MCM8611450.1 DUF4124 domain-containing protein [Accumulibacter sp.]MCM8635084.1 DUF4124 domain-containing protein [Accumulibacter sp.]MCM8641007.1 DUF4124 domain-containing protein [Accumulibacter sp.]
MRRYGPVLATVMLLLAGDAAAQKVYRWVDKQGQVHFSDAPAEDAKSSEVPCAPPPTPRQVDEARQRAERERQAVEAAAAARAQRDASRLSGTANAAPFGPTPENVTSELMRTVGTAVTCDERQPSRLQHTFVLQLHVDPHVPAGAYFEAEFENEHDARKPLRAGGELRAVGFPEVKEESVTLVSPPFDTVRCRNYEVVVRLYRGRTSRELLGTHRQKIGSRVDSALWKAYGENAIVRMMEQGHLCP